MGCFRAEVLPDRLRTESSVWGRWPGETRELPQFNANDRAGWWACFLIAEVPGPG